MRPRERVHRIVCRGWDPGDEARRESLFGVGNGWLYLRGTAPESAFCGMGYAGAYVAGRYNEARRTVVGRDVRITALVNLPYPFTMSFRPCASALAPGWFRLDQGTLRHHAQWLNLRTGTVYRDLVHEDTEGRLTRLSEYRLASLHAPQEAVLRWRLTPLNWSGDLAVCARLPLTVENGKIARHAAYQGRHLDVEPMQTDEEDAIAVHARTLDGEHSFGIQTTMLVDTPPRRGHAWQPEAGTTRLDEHSVARTVTVRVRAGRPTRVRLIARVETWPASDEPAPRNRRACPDSSPSVRGIKPQAGRRPVSADRAAWQALAGKDLIHAPGLPRLERHLRFGAFQLYQAVSRWTEQLDAGFPARGWQEGYFGHIFWDEILAFPFFNLRAPALARGLLRYRHRRLAAAQAAARRAGFEGAMFPWRSAASGLEETPDYQWIPPAQRWVPDNTNLEQHIGSAIAFDAWHHHLAVGDAGWLKAVGAPLMVEIARFWASRAAWAAGDGRFHVHRVVGPDEYHTTYPGAEQAGLTDNAYTNLMAAWTLARATQLPDAMSEADWRALQAELQIGEGELDRWDTVARHIHVPMMDGGVIEQFAGFGQLLPPDAEPLPQRDPGVRVDWWLTAQGLSADAYQLTKQADTLMALHLLSRHEAAALLGSARIALPDGWYEATVAHDLSRNSHGSHLSRIACAGALAEMDPQASWRYFEEALAVDLDDTQGQTDEGLHLGALAGLWDVLQRRYLGVTVQPEGLALDPRAPTELDDVGMTVTVRGHRIALSLQGPTLTLQMLDGPGEGLPVRMADGGWRRLFAGERCAWRCR